MKRLAIILMLSLFLINSCSNQTTQQTTQQTSQPAVEEKTVEQKCIDLCLQELAKNTNLENGPCLSQEIQENWVCDVAHNPRQSVDNQQENQCSSFREGLTHHFVEVSPECNFIRKV